MNELKNQLIEEWFDLSEEELFVILVMDESTEEQMENAIIVLEEKYGYTQEGIIDTAKEKIGKAIDYTKEKAGKAIGFVKDHPVATAVGAAGLLAAKKLGAGEVIKNIKDVALNNVNPFKRDYIVRSFDDFLGGGDPLGNLDHHKLSTSKNEIERKSREPLKFLTPIQKLKNESFSGTTKMQKTFTQFKEELTEEYFIEDLDNESLFYIIESEEFVIEDKKNAVLELIEREQIEITEEVAIFLTEVTDDDYVNKPFFKMPDLSKLKQLVPGLNKPVKPTDPTHPANKRDSFVGPKPLMGPEQQKRYAAKNVPSSQKSGQGAKPSGSSSSTPQKSGQGAKPASALASNTNKTSSSSKSSSVLQQQRSLIAKGAKIKADGIMGPKTAAAQKQFGSKSTSTTSNKPVAPVRKSVPSHKPSPAMNDLRQSVDKLRGTASAAATATNRAKTALSKVPGTGRMNKPTSMSSNDIHSAISKLDGEPTRSTPRQTTIKPLGATKQGAPRASSSKPPTGGKWIPQNNPSSTPVKKALPVPAKSRPSLDLSKFSSGRAIGSSKTKNSTKDLF